MKADEKEYEPDDPVTKDCVFLPSVPLPLNIHSPAIKFAPGFYDWFFLAQTISKLIGGTYVNSFSLGTREDRALNI